jgi:alkanesulfonate monooxygenase SsuD/methylene tetrahydromethanopterin reductase-like flavin-dependent oxidoreductase (luciferase family)
VTRNADAARSAASDQWALYGSLPSYRSMLDREGADGPADVAIVGSEADVTDRVRRLADIGCTEFCGAPFGSGEERRATLGVLAQLAGG